MVLRSGALIRRRSHAHAWRSRRSPTYATGFVSRRLGALAILGLSIGCSDQAHDRPASGESEPAPLSSADAARDKLQRHLDAEASSSSRQLRSVLAPPITAPSSDALRDATEFGLIGLGGEPHAPTAPWGRDDSIASGPGTAKPPQVKVGATTVAGRLPPEVIQRIVRQNFGRFRLCYDAGLRKNPNLQGTVSIKFTINREGAAVDATGEGDMPDADVVRCVSRAFEGLQFPSPEGGIVNVTYPIRFTPGDDTPPPTQKPRTIGGTALHDATWQDVKTALEKAGCKEIEKLEEVDGRVSMKATKDGRAVRVLVVTGDTFRFGSADTAIVDFESRGAVLREKSFLLAIAIDGDTDKSAAKKLLDAVFAE